MPREAFKCYYDKDKDLYRKRVKDANGKYISLYDRDKNVLKKKYDQTLAEIKANLKVNNDVTVAEYATRWYALNTNELSYSRKIDYRVAINNYIAPVIGDMRIKDVQLDNVKKVLTYMNGKSNSMQIKTVTALKQIFHSAKENNIIAQSPCLSLKAGGYKSKEKKPLTKEQSETLIEAVKGTSAYIFVMIGLYTGLRREEILGLCWDCVHLEGTPYISVHRALTFNGCTPVVSDKLKSKAAKRDIPIPPQLTECLKKAEHKSNFVLCNSSGKEHAFNSFRNLWKIVERRTVDEGEEIGSSPKKHPNFKRTIDFIVTPHILRHTYITNLILSGVNLKKVQYLAGHARVSLTLDIYTKLMENKPEDLAEDVIKAFSGYTSG